MGNELNNNQNQADQSQEQNPDNDNTKASKIFTQEEVNEIVKSRLSREQARLESANQAQYAAREAELLEREFVLQAKEAMIARGLPMELASIIKTTDAEGIGKAVELLAKHVKDNTAQNTENTQGFFKVGAPPPNEQNRVEMYREAMGLK